MSIIFQNDPALPPLYHENACNLCATSALAQIFLWKFLTAEQFKLLGDQLIKEQTISPQLSLDHELSPFFVIQRTGRFLNMPLLRGEQVGRISNGVVTFWPHVTEKMFNGVIARVKLSNGVQHFVVYTTDFRPFYNPQPWRTDYQVVEFLLYRLWIKE